jgi:hypothetical protein
VQSGRVLRLAAVMTRDRFVASFTHSFLLIEPPRVDDDGLGFHTSVTPGLVDIDAMPDAQPTKPTVVELVKSPSNPFADRISIGRAPNCDVVLSHPSVSKLHAHVREGEGQVAIVDVGSQNGTFINGKRLEAAVATPVQVGDRVRFGKIRAQLADAAAVFDLLHAPE